MTPELSDLISQVWDKRREEILHPPSTTRQVPTPNQGLTAMSYHYLELTLPSGICATIEYTQDASDPDGWEITRTWPGSMSDSELLDCYEEIDARHDWDAEGTPEPVPHGLRPEEAADWIVNRLKG